MCIARGGIIIKPTVAIDGPAGAGKSSVTKKVAEELGLQYVDTGAMYRALTYKALQLGLNLQDEKVLKEMALNTVLEIKTDLGENLIHVDEEDVTNKIRTPEINKNVSYIALSPGIRNIMVEQQRKMGENGGIIMDGRDICSKVLPGASHKFFLTASLQERARRRFAELQAKGLNVELEEIEKDIARRDEIDENREHNPLVKTDDALLVDTTDMTFEQVVDFLVNYIKG